MNFGDLVKTAMIGVERQPLSAPKSESALDRLQAQVDMNRREPALLSRAVLCALHHRAGALPLRDSGSPPEESPVEKLPRANARAGSLLLRVLGGEQSVLLPEYLTLMGQQSLLAPPEALPGLLEIGRGNRGLQELILSIAGERGRWLAAQNSNWAWVMGSDDQAEKIWETGETAARLLFLERQRKTHPAEARELLASTWKTESPEDRALFVQALGLELSMDDEAFLESALDDKRKEVRKAAASLLARLPESMLSKRMADRVKPLLKWNGGDPETVLRNNKSKTAIIEVTLPAECDKAMQRDGIEVKPPPGFGEKAWWLIQLIENTRLDLWSEGWQASPMEIVRGSSVGEWKSELFEAWTRAAAKQKNGEWAELLFPTAVKLLRHDKFEGLLSAMFIEQREARLSALLEDQDPKTSELPGTVFGLCRHGWSPAFSRTVLTWLKRRTGEPSSDWVLRNQLKDFAPLISASILSEAITGWPTASTEWEFWAKGVDEFLHTIQFRAEMHASITTQTRLP